MKTHQSDNQEGHELRLRPRESEVVSLDIPVDTFANLDKVAKKKGMSRRALLRFYIGQGLRSDLSKMFGDSVLDAATQVLSKRLSSADEVDSVIREIRAESVK